MSDTTYGLVALGDSDRAVSTADEDIRGYDVKDAAGDDVGTVDDLLIDEAENRVRFLVVASGGFLGLGEHKSFLPVDAVTGVGDGEVHIGQPRGRLVGAPAYDPSLVNERDYGESVYGYYGYTPFWSPGYAYPRYPYYG
ncbi:PRC-barrel domain-containing protein [Microbacterium sp.]|uniref:PRC-barrel domain-containing protein n=1 Tax=Microbacterium sp. TaxID=51671 RepID=UPI0037C84A90